MDEIPRIRMSLLALICVAMFAGLLARLWYLQGISQERFETASREQRVRVSTSKPLAVAYSTEMV